MTENPEHHDTHNLPETVLDRFKKTLLGPAKNLKDPHIGHQLSLVAFLAWVGLGADGLSSSSYGPEEAFRALGQHTYLAIFLVLATALTVFIISYAYTKIIEHFPEGGGGYLVATKLLGKGAGIVSGSALFVDYILTITVSIAAGGDALFSLLPIEFQPYKLPVEFGAIILLIVMNLRGVKESVSALIPIFLTFIISHFILVMSSIIMHIPDVHHVTQGVQQGIQDGISQVGVWGLFLVFLRAYSLGGGTYTGIEAVSNGVSILREPRVATGKKTMLYMAISLSMTAGGLLLCYMLAEVHHVPGQTLNTVLAKEVFEEFRLFNLPVGHWFVLVTIFSEAILLLVAAQTGFIDGPRVLANMSQDAWVPRRFGALSDRLTMQNGIILIGAASMGILAYTRGHIGILVVMYSINVFLTFSLSQLGMVRYWLTHTKTEKNWFRDLIVNGIGFLLCFAILCVMVYEKMSEGAWLTVLLTSACVGVCFIIRNHYFDVAQRIREIDKAFDNLPNAPALSKDSDFDPQSSTAIILVGGYSGLGIHIFLNIFRLFKGAFKNVVFLSVGIIDAKFFKSADQIEAVSERTKDTLKRYVDFSMRMGVPARYEFGLGTEVVHSVSELCIETGKKYGHCVFFAGELVFEKPQWYHPILHNETAYAILRQIRFAGLPMVILPIRLPNTPPQAGPVNVNMTSFVS